MDKDKDDPQLRDVLAQRPEGGSRGRRRRVGPVVPTSKIKADMIRSLPANDLLRIPLAWLQQVRSDRHHVLHTIISLVFSSMSSRGNISAEISTGWVGAKWQAGVPGCLWASMVTGLSQARLEHRNGSGGV